MLKDFSEKLKPHRDIDTLIKDIADNQRRSDHLELLSRLPKLRLFLRIEDSPLPDLPIGESTQVKPGMSLKLQWVPVQNRQLALTFTSNLNSNLGPTYVEIEGLEVLKMVLKTTLDGLLIQSTGTGWVGLERKQIEDVVSRRPR